MIPPKDIKSVIAEADIMFKEVHHEGEFHSNIPVQKTHDFIRSVYASALAFGESILPQTPETEPGASMRECAESNGHYIGVEECRSILLEKAEEIMNKIEIF